MPFDNRACFCNGNCKARPAIGLDQKGETEKAYYAARQAVLNAPNCPYTHGIFGHVLSKSGQAQYAEKHIRIAKDLGDGAAQSDVALGHSYIALGRLQEARAAFNSALMHEPQHWAAFVGLARVADAEGDHETALHLVNNAMTTQPDLPGAKIIAAKIMAKADIGSAIDLLKTSKELLAKYELGKLYEKTGDFQAAWNAYFQANKESGKTYQDAEAQKRIANHKAFSSRFNLARLPRLSGPIGAPVTPIFITGYPRSGTTLTETILSSHSKIHAGDELKHIYDIAGMSQPWLQAREQYPFSLMELVLGDKTPVAQAMRTYYLARCMDVHDHGKPYITDKMPLNEMHLPLITMLFNEAPIFYVRRHPLDIIFSNFANYLTHGFNQAFDIDTAATHYARVDELLRHYLSKLDILKFKEIKYETLIAEKEVTVNAMLDFIGVEREPACLEPQRNRNHPRTPSYEAVKKPVNSDAVGRWRNFEQWMLPAMEKVQHILEREGY